MFGSGLPYLHSPLYFPFSPSSPAEKKAYYCQKCENHSERNLRRNHKTECKFRDCQCGPCRMVDDRSDLNAKIKSKLESDSEVERLEAEEAREMEERQQPSNIERKPCCQRCRAHGKKRPLRNHKRHCEFKTCDCEKCKMVDARRQLMAKQIKLRREQKRERERNEQRREEEQRKELLKTLNAHPLNHFLGAYAINQPPHFCSSGPFPTLPPFPPVTGAAACLPNPHYSPSSALAFPYSHSALAQFQHHLLPPHSSSPSSHFRPPFPLHAPLDLSPPTAAVQLPSNLRANSGSPGGSGKETASGSGTLTPPSVLPKPDPFLPPPTPQINVVDLDE